jgi:acetyl-CoA acetyltransferase
VTSTADPITIVGVGTTSSTRRSGRPAIHLFLESIKRALLDAGLTAADIDAVSGSWPGPGGSTTDPQASDWAKQLGHDLCWVSNTHPTSAAALDMACHAISAGVCNTVLFVDGQVSVATSGRATPRGENEFVGPWGGVTPARYAVVAQRHMHLFGTTSEEIAHVSATIRNNGRLNPAAIYHAYPHQTVDTVMASRMVASPFHLLDLSTVTDGAAAMILGNRLTDPDRAVYVRGGATGFRGNCYLDAPVYEELRSLGRDTAEETFRRASVARDEVDIFELFDPNSFEIIRQFEVLGYCGEGEGGSFVSGGRLAVDGTHPTCTDGGMLSHAHIGSGTRILKMKAAIDQIRGEAGTRQVKGATTAIVTAGGSAARYFSMSILSRLPS